MELGDNYFASKSAESLVKGLSGLKVALWEWDLINDHVIISEQYAQMLGFRQQELAGLNLAAFRTMMHPDDATNLQARIDQAINSNQILKLTFRLRNKQGHYQWIKARGYVCSRDSNNRPAKMIGIHVDIEQLLRDMDFHSLLNTRLDALVSQSPNVIFAIRPVDSQLEVVYVSKNFQQVIGLSESCFNDVSKWEDSIHPDDIKPMKQGVGAFMASPARSLLKHRYRVLDPHSSVVWLEESLQKIVRDGKVVEVVGSLSNVTELAEKSQLLEQVASVAPGVIYQFKLEPDGTMCFPYASEKIFDIYGVSAEEATADATSVLKAIHPDDLEPVIASIEASSKTMSTWRYEYRVLRDGHVYWVKGESEPSKQADGSTLWSGLIIDISDLKTTEERLMVSNRRLKHAQEISQLGHWEANLDTGTLYWSDIIYTIFGLDKSSVKPSIKVFNKALHPDDVEAVRASEERAKENGMHDVKHRIIRPDGTIRWVHERASYRYLDGQHILSGTVKDITEQKELELELEYQAIRDPLTGLYNRRYFSESLDKAIQRHQRYGLTSVLCMIDVDDFKLVNDTYGHYAGDQVLKQISTRLLKTVRNLDVVARLGGEEFGILLDNVDVSHAVQVAEKILSTIAAEKVLLQRGEQVSVTSSIGIVLTDEAQLSASTLMNMADKALYEAKRAGKNQVKLYRVTGRSDLS